MLEAIPQQKFLLCRWLEVCVKLPAKANYDNWLPKILHTFHFFLYGGEGEELEYRTQGFTYATMCSSTELHPVAMLHPECLGFDK